VACCRDVAAVVDALRGVRVRIDADGLVVACCRDIAAVDDMDGAVKGGGTNAEGKASIDGCRDIAAVDDVDGVVIGGGGKNAEGKASIDVCGDIAAVDDVDGAVDPIRLGMNPGGREA